MFNNSLKKEAMVFYEDAKEKYNSSYEKMMDECKLLYESRKQSIVLIEEIEKFINTIANTPKEFDKKLGKINEELLQFKETEEFAKRSFEDAVYSGIEMGASVAAGMAFAGIAPTIAMQVATTFGKASTGIAIKALSGAAAKKAALAWLGRGAISVGGTGIAGGQALLALAGPIGWSITGVSVAATLYSLTKKNKKIAEEIIKTTKEIMKTKEQVDEYRESIGDLRKRTKLVRSNLRDEFAILEYLKNADFTQLDIMEKEKLGTLVNNTLSLSTLINKTIE